MPAPVNLSPDTPFQIPEAPGRWFLFEREPDTDADSPWDAEDGHGPVRCVRAPYGLKHQNIKRPGEREMHTDYPMVWLYDWQAACKLARADAWNAAPYDAPNRIERAVQADFDRLRDYLHGHWWYVGVVVRPCTEDGTPLPGHGEHGHSLWGIESDSPDYHAQVALELAASCASDHGWLQTQTDAAAALQAAEDAEAYYWACRDVATA